MRTSVTAIVRSATELLFPSRCVGCGADSQLLCDNCVSDSTRLVSGSQCRKCALPARGDLCEACFADPPALNRAVAVFQYDGAVRSAVLQLKYDDLRAISQRIAALMAEAMPNDLASKADVTAPIPMATNRQRSRGYNQSALLAKRISRILNVPFDENLLRRTRDTGPQVEMRSEAERKANMDGAFVASDRAHGKRVLLIDDVMTTGSTLNSCAAELKKSGATHVSGLVLCREL